MRHGFGVLRVKRQKSSLNRWLSACTCMCGGAQVSPNTSHVIRKWMVNTTLMKGHQNDGSNHGWSERCVCIYGWLTSRFSRQANTPPPSGGFFHSFSRQWLAINLEKCVFATPFLKILGHKISATGAAPPVDHAAKIENCPPHQDIKQLQCFFGMLIFYRRFMLYCA